MPHCLFPITRLHSSPFHVPHTLLAPTPPKGIYKIHISLTSPHRWMGLKSHCPISQSFLYSIVIQMWGLPTPTESFQFGTHTNSWDTTAGHGNCQLNNTPFIKALWMQLFTNLIGKKSCSVLILLVNPFRFHSMSEITENWAKTSKIIIK